MLPVCPGMAGGRVEQGLPAGGEAVLLVKVEHGLILWFWPWGQTDEYIYEYIFIYLVPEANISKMSLQHEAFYMKS